MTSESCATFQFVSRNTVLLERCYTRLLACCLWLLSSDGTEELTLRPASKICSMWPLAEKGCVPLGREARPDYQEYLHLRL